MVLFITTNSNLGQTLAYNIFPILDAYNFLTLGANIVQISKPNVGQTQGSNVGTTYMVLLITTNSNLGKAFASNIVPILDANIFPTLGDNVCQISIPSVVLNIQFGPFHYI